MSQKLLFIYNANSDTSSQLLDFAHKIMSPKTYDCKLCELTFGKFTEKRQWKTFRKKLKSQGFELSFLHKDEFQKSYKSKFGHKFNFPIILLETAHDLEVVMSAETLNGMETVEQLVSVVESSMSSGS